MEAHPSGLGAPADAVPARDQPPSGLPPGTVVVTMPDELDHLNAPQIRQLAAAFAPGVHTVIADFTPTTFCDSSGVAEIVTAYKHAAARNVAFRVVVAHRSLTDFLARTGIAALLSIYPSMAQALHPGLQDG